jgi:hypothetical protein
MSLQLRPTDILMWRIVPGASWVDRFIGWGERVLNQVGSKQVNYYHVGFVGPGVFHFYQSKPPKICNSDIPQDLPSNIEVYRLKVPMTDNQVKAVMTYANSQIGKWYNFLGVLTGGYIQVGSFSFCSQFTWQAFTYAGVVLCPWETLESPDDIANSDLLLRVSPPV